MSSTVCYPPGADWTCAYTQDELDAMRADPATAAVMDRSDALAWMTLATLTADQIGTCPVLVRPTLARCRTWPTYITYPVGAYGHYAGVRLGESAFMPFVSSDGAWVNGCGCSSAACSCESLCEAILPGTVGHILEVRVDGQVLPATAYRVDNGNRLVRTDGGECWPSCQDLAAEPTEPGTFAVTYYPGAAPDDITRWAAGLLAVEYYKACQNQACRLPAHVQNVTRMGVTYQVNTDMFTDGGTGIREVDAVVARYNPFHLKARPIVTSPDAHRQAARVPTWGQ